MKVEQLSPDNPDSKTKIKVENENEGIIALASSSNNGAAIIDILDDDPYLPSLELLPLDWNICKMEEDDSDDYERMLESPADISMRSISADDTSSGSQLKAIKVKLEEDSTHKNEDQDGTRKNEDQDGTRKNEDQDGTRKNEDQDGTRKNEEEDDETLNLAETYAEYTPQKLKIGKPHPDPIVETASLSGVASPDVNYLLQLPASVINNGQLSAPQLEAVVYACQQHEFFLAGGERAGYLIGDGAGVGKGRTIAGIIYENWIAGRRKALWVSISADLKEDSVRDMRDVGAKCIKVHSLNKFTYGKINPEKYADGVLFSTYSGLIGKTNKEKKGKFNTRLDQIIDWLGKDFDGVIVFDESHRAKNLCPVKTKNPTKTGVTVAKLQGDLPRARVVYASATGASEPKNMAYMTRLGIWGKGTPFEEFVDLIRAIEKRGIKAMEIVAMDMKTRGAYIARQLSFKGVTFRIEEVPLTDDFLCMYNDSVDLWVEALQKFLEAEELLDLDKAIRKVMWCQFWGCHQRFFKYLCIAGKLNRVVSIAKKAVEDGKCVVIGLQSTGEARAADQFEKEGALDDFISTAKGVFQNLVEKHFPPEFKPQSNKNPRRSQPVTPTPSSSGQSAQVRKSIWNVEKRKKYDNSGLGSSLKVEVKVESSGIDSDSSFKTSKIRNSDMTTLQIYTGSSRQTNNSRKRKLTIDNDSSSSNSRNSDAGTLQIYTGSTRQANGRKHKVGKETSGNGIPKTQFSPSRSPVEKVALDRTELLEKIEKLGSQLPTNTLDQLIHELGGPCKVAELTGRTKRLIRTENGPIEYQKRVEDGISMNDINLTEKRRFMDGEKLIAIISEAASNGISLQSDSRVKNKRRRVHITLELPWSADKAIQQFGRTHRSNQSNAPEYVFLISDLAGERRFASIVAKRLESLGALTHGDRRATETRDLSRFHVDNIYGRKALKEVMKYITTGTTLTLPVQPPTCSYIGDFRSDIAHAMFGVGLMSGGNDDIASVTPEINCPNMSKFLNRILGMHVILQNSLFKFFTDILSAIVANAKKQGRFDMGLLNLGDSNENKTRLISTDKFSRKHATGTGIIELHTVEVDRGFSWEEAHQKAQNLRGQNDGFYVSVTGDRTRAVLVLGDDFPVTSDRRIRYYSIYRPHLGLQMQRETIREIRFKYKKTTSGNAIQAWENQYHDSGIYCYHEYWSDSRTCKNKMMGLDCIIGKRQRTYHILSGSVLLCWDDVEAVMKNEDGEKNKKKIEIVRVQFIDGMKFVGVLIPTECLESLKEKLLSKSEITESNWNQTGNDDDDAEFFENMYSMDDVDSDDLSSFDY